LKKEKGWVLSMTDIIKEALRDLNLDKDELELIEQVILKKKATSFMKTDNPIEILRDTINPTEFEESQPHNLIDHDGALSYFPDSEYALHIAEFKTVASYFQELGYTKIAALIHAEANQKVWQLMGTKGWLRDKLNETKTTANITKTETKQGGIVDKIR